jgi:hypothetical protein
MDVFVGVVAWAQAGAEDGTPGTRGLDRLGLFLAAPT